MDIDGFVNAFVSALDDTEPDQVTPDTRYQELDEWSSLMVLSLIIMIDNNFHKEITGKEIRSLATVRELYDFILAK